LSENGVFAAFGGLEECKKKQSRRREFSIMQSWDLASAMVWSLYQHSAPIPGDGRKIGKLVNVGIMEV